MPLLLGRDEYPRWLDNSRRIDPDDTLFRRELKMDLRLQPVSRAVNNARNKDPRALEPIGEVVELRAGGLPGDQNE
jgi:putative SOS response-associated peptidase YedK